jgi:hypothetical protein
VRSTGSAVARAAILLAAVTGCAVALGCLSATAPAYATPLTEASAPAQAGVASLESTTTTPTPDATPAPSPDTTAAPSAQATPTAVFATQASYKLRLNFPAKPADMFAVGFHQACGHDALTMKGASQTIGIHSPATTKRLLNMLHGLKLFQQPLRGRGTSNLSAADCAMKPKAVVLAPVTGTVTSVKQYWLYGRYRDIRLEIRAAGASNRIRVIVLHITNTKVKAGAHVVGGVTPIATVRHFSFASAVNRFLTAKHADHVHIQINRV